MGKQLQSVIITVRGTKEQQERFKQAATSAGLSLNQFAITSLESQVLLHQIAGRIEPSETSTPTPELEAPDNAPQND